MSRLESVVGCGTVASHVASNFSTSEEDDQADLDACLEAGFVEVQACSSVAVF